TFRSIYDSNGHRSWELKTRSTSSHAEPGPCAARRAPRWWPSGGQSTRHSSNGWVTTSRGTNSSDSGRSNCNGRASRRCLAAPWSPGISSSLRNSNKRWHESLPSGTGFEHKAGRHRKLSRLFTEKPYRFYQTASNSYGSTSWGLRSGSPRRPFRQRNATCQPSEPVTPRNSAEHDKPRSSSQFLTTGNLVRRLASGDPLKPKSQNGAPCISVWVRTSRISGLKPSARAKSRWQDRLAPSSARPRAWYISA